MPLSRAPRWWSRLLRKQLLVVAAVGVIILAACAPALADEPAPRAAVPPDTTALARGAIVAGRLDEAVRLLSRLVMSERPEDERAAAFEMRAVVDRWIALGATIAPRTAAEPAPLPGSGADDAAPAPDAWESAFAVSRARLAAGSFQDAGPGFALLLGSARSSHQWLRANALASLASELVAKDMVLRVVVRPARVASPEVAAPSVVRTHTHWYGWQTLLVDGASLLVLPAVAMTSDSAGGGLLLVAGGGYLLGGPIVHLAHGEVARAFASLGLRAGLPLVGGFVGVAAAKENCRGELCGLGGAFVGAALGMVAATIIDPAALAYEKVEDESSARSDRPAPVRSRVALSPLAGPRKEGGFDVGLGGTF
ncbi:MAG TPA: hypothetical protein VLT33_48520 [Labilithrix sp.]|nr:hypothetical protein [Labilithrix sp.]